MSDVEWSAWALVALLAAVIALGVVWRAASRIDRLHRRVISSRATLDAQLVRRATAAWDLASAGVLDPASAVLVATAAREALEEESAVEVGADALTLAGSDDEERSMVESELSRVLRSALGGSAERAELVATDGAADLLERLDQASYRVQLARRFYNDAVVQVRRIRAKWYVRLFRLAGRAPTPRTFEIDDATAQP